MTAPPLGERLKRAVAAFERRDLDQCEQLCREALQRGFEVNFSHLLALVCHMRGDYAEAIDWLDRTLSAQPQHHLARRNRMRILREGGHLKRALADARELLSHNPSDATLAIAASEMALDLDQLDLAKELLAFITPGSKAHTDAMAALAIIAEQQNDDQTAEKYAREALAVHSNQFKARYVLGLLALKQKRFVDAELEMRELMDSTDQPINQSLVASRLGEALERQGRYVDAFTTIEDANRRLAGIPRVQGLRGTSHYGPEFVEALDRLFRDERIRTDLAAPPIARGEASAPVFLVGFPRSGTTLLDRILQASPDVIVIEEKPTLEPLLTGFNDAKALVDFYLAASPSELELRAQAYWQHRQQWLDRSAPIIIDKMPLNAVFVPLLQRVFPQSRFIVARRDPRDVCLSCFFQSFGLNEAMAQFLNWEGTARYFALVMGLLNRALTQPGIRFVTVHYEKLVANPQAELSDVFELLDIAWDPAMQDFHHGSSGRINTPSYRQVNQGLYRGSIQRWRNYPEAMERIAGILDGCLEAPERAKQP